jgi:nicotinamide-nucleotide amidase
MRDEINAEVISIGTEILLGELTDTNSVFIAKTLRDLGINLYYMTSVGDNENRIVNALRLAMSRAQVIITCGGLGPTVDDMTRQSVATATDRNLVFQPDLLEEIEARFASFKVQMTENNRRQAFLPSNAITVTNPVGTAPSFIVRHQQSIIIALPGVPREMKYLMNEAIIPFLREEYSLGIIKAHTLKTAGIGESSLDDLLGSELLNSPNPSIGLAAHSGQIDIRITAKADDEIIADAMISDMSKQVYNKAGKFIFGSNEDRLEDVLIRFLTDAKMLITIIEVGFIDGVTDHILNHRGAEDVILNAQKFANYKELFHQYNLTLKETKREISHNVAEQVLLQNDMLSAVIVILSDPDIDENMDESEGTVIVVRTLKHERSRVYGFGSRSELAQKWVSSWSMSTLWRLLREDMEYD